MSTSLQPAAMPSSVRCSLLILCASLAGASLAEIVFRCPGCTAERQALCAAPTETCAEIVREPGCGCCPVCARQEGETCGVYTPRCATGLRCYPTPDSELPLEQLVQGEGQCRRKVDPETSTHSQEHREPTSGFISQAERSELRSDVSSTTGTSPECLFLIKAWLLQMEERLLTEERCRVEGSRPPQGQRAKERKT
ncbi:unnamed protein product [Pleuronectes platessa]|uniref:IGFBP N-terminal domain-containing protein n=1 Tax=Pleuronectes platessa TaxID=8262 RepID=A0A9N7Y8P2_PLEPL|nr:unnamed protein product [Pleuronectes platessa]